MSTEKTEILILVIGVTGAGKSHFINTVHGAQKAVVGKYLSPCTVEVDVSYVDAPKKYPQYRIGLVDTPGFDATAKEDDLKVLKTITAWVKKSYERGAKLGGVIYLHDIKAARFDDAARRNLQMLQGMWEDYVPIVLGTTKGAQAVRAPEDLLDELVNKKEYWKPLIDKGAQAFSFDDSYDSAWKFIDAILTWKPEILILVMGATGVGKSRFINTLLKAEKMAVGRDLNSCTVNVDFDYLDDPKEDTRHRIALVDTPGFSEAALKDFQVLEGITAWLKKSYRRGTKLGGIIYLYDITAPLSASIGIQHLQTFRQMSGQNVPIVLGTIKRALAVPGSMERQSQLLNHWKPLIDKGAQAFSFDDTYDSAWKFIDAILTWKPEFLILVMGATGVGKSRFINTLLKAEKMAVGRDLNSCTVHVDFDYVDDPKENSRYRIALVDTPGFSEVALNDFQVLEGITAWLKKSYQRGAKLGGIIYLYDITAPLSASKGIQHLQAFRQMSGQNVPIVLGTTKNALAIPGSVERQSQLLNYWKPLIDKGVQAFSFDDSYESAWAFINAILSGKNIDVLHQPVPQIHRYGVAPHLPQESGIFRGPSHRVV